MDKVERRRQIADAPYRIVAEEGWEGGGIRAVAAEAQISAGAVQRGFGTGEELLHFAFQAAAAETTERSRAFPAR